MNKELGVRLHRNIAKRIRKDGFEDYRFDVLAYIDDYLEITDDEQNKVMRRWKRLTKCADGDIIEFLVSEKNTKYFDCSPMLVILTPGERLLIEDKLNKEMLVEGGEK